MTIILQAEVNLMPPANFGAIVGGGRVEPRIADGQRVLMTDSLAVYHADSAV